MSISLSKSALSSKEAEGDRRQMNRGWGFRREIRDKEGIRQMNSGWGFEREIRDKEPKECYNGGMNNGFQKNRQGFRDNMVNVKYAYMQKALDPKPAEEKSWKISNENIEELKKSANKYNVLAKVGNMEDEEDPCLDKRNKNVMCDDEDVFENINQVVNDIIADEILGSGSGGSKALIGDFNVILKLKEQSSGSFGLNNYMEEFRRAVNLLEIDDLYRVGFNFTWIKSLKNPATSTLKKLNRIMINESFIMVFEKAHGVFLPYLISDHIPSMLFLPDGLLKKKRSFRFNNHAIELEDGNLFERVEKLKASLAEAQGKLDVDPSNVSLKESCVIKYAKAIEDELTLLHQKAKVNWFREGDRNSSYFHSVLKTRNVTPPKMCHSKNMYRGRYFIIQHHKI
nr:hypothetical protein [Tanacetum cinerariifolium]